MRIFVLSLIMPFLACVAGYFYLRSSFENWPPPDAVGLPPLLWVCTGLILVTSATVHWGVIAVKSENQRGLKLAMLLTLMTGIAFFVCQSIAFQELVASHRPVSIVNDDEAKQRHLILVTFVLLVGLHLIHVFGGLLLQLVVTVRALLGRYRYYHHPGVTYSMMYWHFLDAMWLVVFVTLWLGNGAD
jgi:cytochrome c oxidase subunit 3